MPTQRINLQQYIRSIPDWPKPGILFRDITPLLADPKAFAAAVDALCEGFTPHQLPLKFRPKPTTASDIRNLSIGAGFTKADVDYVAAVEARGFIFGAAVASKLKVGFVPIRKKGKLPFKTETITYALEYGTDTLQVHIDAVNKGSLVGATCCDSATARRAGASTAGGSTALRENS